MVTHHHRRLLHRPFAEGGSTTNSLESCYTRTVGLIGVACRPFSEFGLIGSSSFNWIAASLRTFHVQREQMVAKFWLQPVVQERSGGFSRRELNTLEKLVVEHREQLVEKWNEFFGS